ncbi:MAG: sensor domain-containing diguanylate cyclase [Acidimicrobiales bacterium]|nr:sensor domain-containing diguanylate cyclase [Acidimicrobiales bacterium]
MSSHPPRALWRAGPASAELTSLDERLGLLLVVRIGFVLLVMLGSLFASDQVIVSVTDVGPLSAAYLVVAAGAEWYRRSQLKGRMLVHRLVLPLDAVYLAVISTPSGGPRSPLVALFAVQLIAVTLLGSPRAGLRTALWDTFLFVLIPALSLSGRIGQFLGVSQVAAPSTTETTVAILGFWVVAGCTSIFSAVSERELRRSKAEMSALAEMASTLENVREEEEILAILLRALVQAFPLKRGALWYTHGTRPLGLVLPSATGEVANVPVPPLARADRVAVLAWGDREPQLVRHLSPDDDPVVSGLLPEAANVAVLPLQVEGNNSGIIVLEHGGHRLKARLPRRTLVMLAQFAGHASLTLRNARLLAERERLAAIDGLTGLANRREFDQVLSREVNRAERSHEPLSLVVFDVDHFKQINDSRGHLGGDEVLRSIGSVLAGAVREMDLVSRYGGEEFAIILPRCDQHDAIRVVERITKAVRQHPDLVAITLSSGVATIPFNAPDGLSLVAAADEALYESKRTGRDRYSVSARRPDSTRSFGSLGV